MSNISTDLQDVEKIIVLDYGSQYNQLISRRIREIGVFSELKSHKISADEVRAINPIGIVLSGGPNSVYEEGSFDIDPEIFELGIPILGICYGMQLLTHKLGGKVVLIIDSPHDFWRRIMSITLHDRKEEFFLTLVVTVELTYKPHLTNQPLTHLRKHFLIFHRLIRV